MATTEQIALEKYVDTVLHKIAKQENIENLEINYGSGNGKGEGYLSLINFIELKGSNKTIHTIMKTATMDKEVRKMVPIRESFNAEVKFYQKAVPMFDELQKSLEVPFEGYPKCYATNMEEFKELIILKNLKIEGYEIVDRFKPLDAEHTEMILAQYGKLHALSLALRDQQPEKFSELADYMGDNMKRWFVDGKMIDTCKWLCERFKPMIQDEAQLKRYTKFCDKMEDFVDYDYKTDPFSAVAHADCWSNNMMFKYETKNGTKTLVDAKLIDFQISRCTSIIFDVAHFLCTCTDHTIWEQLDYYLNIYHKNLCLLMRQLGSDPIKIIPFKVFKEEFAKKCKFGMIMSSMFIKVMLIEGDEAPEFKDMDLSSPAPLGFVNDISRQADYDKRFMHLIDYFYKHNFY